MGLESVPSVPSGQVEPTTPSATHAAVNKLDWEKKSQNLQRDLRIQSVVFGVLAGIGVIAAIGGAISCIVVPIFITMPHLALPLAVVITGCTLPFFVLGGGVAMAAPSIYKLHKAMDDMKYTDPGFARQRYMDVSQLNLERLYQTNHFHRVQIEKMVQHGILAEKSGKEMTVLLKEYVDTKRRMARVMGGEGSQSAIKQVESGAKRAEDFPLLKPYFDGKVKLAKLEASWAPIQQEIRNNPPDIPAS